VGIWTELGWSRIETDGGLNQSNSCVQPSASSPYACCNNWYVSVAVFPDFKTKLDKNALFGTFTHHKYRYDINARVTSATYCSQLSKRSHSRHNTID